MRVLGLALAGVLFLTVPAPAGEPGGEIETVIADQIAAFQEGALTRAFSHASPDIQSKFQTPQTFGQMVQHGYPMIWRPSSWGWGSLTERDGRWVQTVEFEDARGKLYEAEYIMEMIDGVWRIDGVYLREIPGVSS